MALPLKYNIRNIVVRKGSGGAMELERRPIPPMPTELAAIIEENR